MASLREILEQQKAAAAAANAKGKANGATTQPVLPVASANSVPKETEGKKETLLEKIAREKREREKAKLRGNESNNNDTGRSDGATNSVVEQGPPEGLSGIQLALWKKKNGAQEQKSSTGQTPTAEQTVSAEQATKSNSASQAADAQKTNDGAIDPAELKRNLEYLANNINQKELVGQIIRTIAIQLRQNPQLTPFMTDADVDLVVRGFRAAYEIAARKRAEKSETKRKSTKLDIDIGEMLKSGGLDLKL